MERIIKYFEFNGKVWEEKVLPCVTMGIAGISARLECDLPKFAEMYLVPEQPKDFIAGVAPYMPQKNIE